MPDNETPAGGHAEGAVLHSGAAREAATVPSAGSPSAHTPAAESDQRGGLPQVLREYGQAFRGDWSSTAIDGRSVRDEMAEIAAWVDHPETYPGDEQARVTLGICPAGNGHWSWLYCDDDCVTTPPGKGA